ncbi:DCL family protein [Leifsonia sp. PS1209]|uniref:DCL family protein n=1 Tax=Leifsonia sp. PS1209 TaxID=2724914 RepID=UPI001442AFCB|nr:DCL family protein [Leifsonia sp. PS1209]QIZ99423.1 DCL family protein [Leifsonia sp. PS1209]
MVAKPVKTSTLEWPTRQAAEADCLRILRGGRYQPGDIVADPSDVAIISAILSIHPHARDKVGAGVDHFSVRTIAGVPGTEVSEATIGFWLTRVDGSEVDFSYVEAIYPSDQKRRVTSALRAEVDDLRLSYRQARFEEAVVASDRSGAPFTERSAAAVIYENPSFSQLAFRFAESEGGWDDIEVLSGESKAFVGDRLASPNVRARWRRFYSRYARPKLVTKSESSKRSRVDESAWLPD